MLMAGTNNAVTKALEMLDLLGGADQGLRLKAIAQQLGLPESTAHRLLASLVESGFVEQRDEHGEYSLGWKIVVLANAMGRDSRLVQMVRPYLEELVHRLLGYHNQRDAVPRVANPFIVEPGEAVNQVRAGFLHQDVDLVQNHHQVDVPIDKVLPENLKHLGHREAAVRKSRLELRQYLQ